MIDLNKCVVCGKPSTVKTIKSYYDKDGKEIIKSIDISWCDEHYKVHFLLGQRLPEEAENRINVSKPKIWQDGKVNI